jgi:hypothetical protein
MLAESLANSTIDRKAAFTAAELDKIFAKAGSRNSRTKAAENARGA